MPRMKGKWEPGRASLPQSRRRYRRLLNQYTPRTEDLLLSHSLSLRVRLHGGEGVGGEGGGVLVGQGAISRGRKGSTAGSQHRKNECYASIKAKLG
ncbi:UNVERIFIED_CONTAM: hypothetical protein Sradi_1910800 [Sesamum radiatum]|uniref:Uncharacterized protein n=1 Tax=Sesamum radiatum TaxID=300843 RepID=A0AAW2TYE9_SESRA